MVWQVTQGDLTLVIGEQDSARSQQIRSSISDDAKGET